MNEYRSLHPNHVHQLVVNVSKHYYATKNGCLKYQQKALETSLSTLSDSDRTSMVVLSLRDHCSALFYAELEFGRALPSVTDFLRNAWGTKVDFDFCGLPDCLMLPKTVEVAFPELASQLETIGVRVLKVTSGFQGGIGDLRLIERWLSAAVGHPISEAKKRVRNICIEQGNTKARTDRESKLELWKKFVPSVRHLPGTWPKDLTL